jgi:hypothetical protein
MLFLFLLSKYSFQKGRAAKAARNGAGGFGFEFGLPALLLAG